MQETHQQTSVQPIQITSTAMAQLRRIMDEQEIPGEYGLRVGVKGGGCSGFSYILGFDQKKERDSEYMIENIKVYIDKVQSMYLIGMEIDWHEGLNNRGFIFNNPNAQSSCGCGTSFSA